MSGSPGPDGLKIRQTRDATVIRVLPHQGSTPLGELGGSVLLVVAWAVLRSQLAGGISGLLLGGMVVAGLLVLGGSAHRRLQRRREVLEVYVGKRFLELVTSRGGAEVRRSKLELVRLEDAEARVGAVKLLVEDGEPMWLPMEPHSDEARAWMVEHLRGAGLGARRRFGTLGEG